MDFIKYLGPGYFVVASGRGFELHFFQCVFRSQFQVVGPVIHEDIVPVLCFGFKDIGHRGEIRSQRDDVVTTVKKDTSFQGLVQLRGVLDFCDGMKVMAGQFFFYFSRPLVCVFSQGPFRVAVT